MNINNVDYINCTGCAACSSICHSDAIIMQENMEGFKYPKVIEEKCTDCNICVKICPALNISDHINKNQICYAVKGQDDIRYKSSSGGFFTYIAEYVIEMGGGCVAGAAFDENLYLSHIIVDNKHDLEKLKKSKYIQSDINNTFREIKKLLKNDRYVLFSGTPCQVAGLKSYLKKDYDNLITLDLVCHGVPPQKLFHKYLEENFPNEKIISYDFRDKSKGWETLVEYIKTENNKFKEDLNKTVYGKAFLQNISLRECCGKCDYTNLNRSGDITIGDFWGINEYKKSISDNKGISLILLNTTKGKEIFDNIKTELKEYEQIPIDYAVRGNPVLQRPVSMHINRDKFFQTLEEKSVEEAYNICIHNTAGNIGIINFSHSNWNFGAVLTGYALQHYLRQEYKDANILNIQYTDDTSYKKERNQLFDDFRQKYISETELLFNDNRAKFTQYINCCETIIYGSDQVFRYEFVKSSSMIFLGVMAAKTTKLLAVAAGFGDDESILINKKILPVYSDALKRFSALSVREDFGLTICKNLGIENVKHILDPVCLLEISEYEKFIDKNIEKKEIFVYILYEQNKELYNKFVEDNKETLGYKTSCSIVASEKNNKIEEWITYINNSDIVITSSFHGALFSIIFGKEFIFINKDKTSAGRINSLCKMLDIEKRVYSDFNDVDIEFIKNNKLNYEKINKKLNMLKEITKQYISEAMEHKLTKEEIKEKEDTSILIKYYKKEYIRAYKKYKIYSIKLKLYKFFGKYERIYNKYILIKERKNEIKFILKQLKKNL